MFTEFLNRTFLGNTPDVYLTSAAVFIGGVLIVRVFHFFVIRRMKAKAGRTGASIDFDFLRSVEKPLMPLLYLTVLYFRRIVHRRTSACPGHRARGIHSGRHLPGDQDRLFRHRAHACAGTGRGKRPAAKGTRKAFREFRPHQLPSLVGGTYLLLDNLGFEISP